MLVCPHCQFENPNANKFCQQCGTSLTQNVCPDCGSNVSFDASTCQNCGAVTGTFWWAIISQTAAVAPQTQSSASSGSSELGQTAPVNFTADPTAAEAPLPVASETGMAGPVTPSSVQYLDPQHRYQLVDPLPADITAPEVQVRVLDCQPFQVSPLQALSNQRSQATEADSDADITLPLLEPQTASPSSPLKAVVIPAIAQPYVALQPRFYQTIPEIHDAWQDQQQQVVLLEDRSTLPLMVDLWRDSHIPPLQVLHWLHEMTELWAALELWHCCPSLLQLENLRVDEDQALCLRRLYAESGPSSAQAEGSVISRPVTLQDLGQLWQTLFDQSQQTQLGSLALLMRDLKEDKITTVQELRSRLEAVADELQDSLTTATMSNEFDDAELLSAANGETIPLIPTLADPTAATEVDPVTKIQFDPQDLAGRGDDEGDDMPTVVLPMRLVSLEEAGRTDTGRQRDHNEDCFGIDTKLGKRESPTGRMVEAQGLYVLCDGMGGHASGEVASALAVETLRRYFRDTWLNAPPASGRPKLPTEAEIREAVRLANQAIYDVNQQKASSGSGRMGTTLVLALVQDTDVAIAHVGDSRLYRYSRKRGLEQVTLDHEVGQREILRGVEPAIAYARADAYQLTQALGPRDEDFVNPDVQFFDINEDTLLILCSDGLSDNDLLETHWHTHLERLLSSQTNLEQGVRQLIDLANQYNGHDNITAVAVRMKVRPNLEQMR